ncbi:MAG: helix-turn-helix domain-containing protein [Candidatus Paceibacterota bacterium]|jgi:sugar-specific transcriptional regulator TrmB
MNQEIQEKLEKTGLLPHEALVYLEIIKRGSLTPHQLESFTGLNRTTIYGIAKSLEQKGLVVEDRGTTKKKFLAEPESLKQLLEEDAKKVREKTKIIEAIIPELNSIALNSKYTLPKIQFIEEKNIARYLHKETASWNESAQKYDNTWWGFQDYRLVEHYFSWINEFWKFPSSKNITARIFSNDSNIEKQMANKRYPRRFVKFMDSERFTGTMWVVGDHIVMIVTTEHPFYLVHIRDQVLASNQREIFKQLWKVIK